MIQWNDTGEQITCLNLKERSYKRDVLVFKHSYTCSISQMAKLRLENQWDDTLDLDVYLVDVKGNRSLSLSLADELQIVHESPQVLLLRNGECIYDASHFDITIEELKEVLEWHAGAQ
jgi:bacillithiol system protein YtxJ